MNRSWKSADALLNNPIASRLKHKTVTEYLFKTYKLEFFYPEPIECAVMALDPERLTVCANVFGALIIEEDLFAQIISEDYRMFLSKSYGEAVTLEIKNNVSHYHTISQSIKDEFCIRYQLSKLCFNKPTLCNILFLDALKIALPRAYRLVRLRMPKLDETSSALNLISYNNVHTPSFNQFIEHISESI